MNSKEKQIALGNHLKLKTGLFFKFTIIISSFVSIMVIISGLIILKSEQNALMRETEKQTEQLAALIAEISAFQIDRYSYFVLDENSRRLQKSTDNGLVILSVLIFDNRGNKLNPSGIDLSDIKLSKKNIIIKEKPCVIIDKNKQEKTLGSVILVVSALPVLERIDKARLQLMGLVFILTILVNLFIAYFFYIIIINPLKLLKNGAERIANGKLGTQVVIKGNDEISYLAQSFNKMSEELKSSFNKIENNKIQIEKHNFILEETVTLRTAELVNYNHLLRKQLDIAQKIQESMIPRVFPYKTQFDFAFKYEPMELLGGDFFDVFEIGKKYLGIIMLDVSGHGVSSALITAMAKICFKSNATENRSPIEVLRAVNAEIFHVLGGLEEYLIYFTGVYGILNIETGHFNFCNAAHPDTYIVKDHTIYLSFISESQPIGAFCNPILNEKELFLSAGDKLILYTDGIVDARNVKKEMFGTDALLSILLSNYSKSAKQISDIIMESVNNFRQGVQQEDDMTLLIMDVLTEFPAKTNVP